MEKNHLLIQPKRNKESAQHVGKVFMATRLRILIAFIAEQPAAAELTPEEAAAEHQREMQAQHDEGAHLVRLTEHLAPCLLLLALGVGSVGCSVRYGGIMALRTFLLQQNMIFCF